MGWLGLLLSRAALQSLAVTGAFYSLRPGLGLGVQSVDVTLLCSSLFQNFEASNSFRFWHPAYSNIPHTEAAQRYALKRPLTLLDHFVARGNRRVLVRLGLHGF